MYALFPFPSLMLLRRPTTLLTMLSFTGRANSLRTLTSRALPQTGVVLSRKPAFTSRRTGVDARSVTSLRTFSSQAEVILVGCGAPDRGMGWYHAVQMLDGRGEVETTMLG